MGSLRLTLPPLPDDEARDYLAQAQAALADEQRAAALRALRRLHGLLVPPVDRFLQGLPEPPPLSAAVGLLALWSDLPNIDIERVAPGELLLRCAAAAEEREEASAALAPALAEDQLATQWAWLEERLGAAPRPRPSWWRRLRLGAAGAIGDRAHVQVQRGAAVVLERLPDRSIAVEDCETDLGPLAAGDRLTLRVQTPLPGRVAVLHAAGDETEAELTVLLPAGPAEEVVRRALEVVEVSGEIGPVEGAPEQALVVLWAPELIPAGWYAQVLARRRLPPEARLWRYRYRITP